MIDNQIKVKKLAKHLTSAWEGRKGVQPITGLSPDITIDEAYDVQLYTINQKVNSGQRITGKKIGLTSKAMQEMLGVNEPDYGHLLNSMEYKNGEEVTFTHLLQPKVEGEVAFILKNDLTGPNITVSDVLQATDTVAPALEIVDSRIKDWKIRLEDTVADNASSGLYVLGEKFKTTEGINLKQIEMALYKNGELINTGVGAAALGDPAKCVAWLANKLSSYGISLRAGEIILSGALSAAVDAAPGDLFHAKFTGLGEVHVTFKE
ncbi:2-keto-4-pentenoate hydratase [Virgibacillus pantothenticus]|uniref:2-keto-4-pentenoate hydratase n=1 Tax=Virgibacillus TaxID=84406 RepID=UPI00090C713F|nr:MULTISPECIES: 2-keto-4-pentenoate hydratase [Virgibacillus]API92024.1 2-keto-4-pentenoate hydratase [Virgibacillus sp. 6R]MBS7430487.1 fumarylacetoacetate hydrolase family protein [Virgibacillus sp. 19R1-5]MBU8566425.1 2-keto-4-pentenoate hydratase [Virgibacillus pantothenticus]MBU8600160.1 2-keto-4-pentenoate hydratase [Virgibacillus pantothenticus]MBU8633908.1 2-keto-4-pentenoate hydratase [Virgibacillus pantothenticus]